MRRPAAAGLAGQGAEILSQVLLVSAVPAAMGPAAYGEFALALAVAMMGSAAVTLGGPAILTRYIPAAGPQERDAVARALVRRLALVRAGQVAAVTTAGVVLALASPGAFPAEVVAAVVLAIALDVAATLTFQAALGFGAAWLWSLRFALQNLLLVAGAIALHEAGGPRAAVWAIAMASGLALWAGVAAAGPRLRAAPRGGSVPAGALRFGLLQAASSLLLNVQHRGAVVAVALLGGTSTETGFASLALGIGLAGFYAVRQAFTVELPGAVEHAGTRPELAEAPSQRLAAWLLALAVPGALVAAVLGGDLLALAAGEGFRGAESALAPALALVPLAVPLTLAGQIAALRLRPEARLWTTAAGLVVFLAVAGAAVPSGGAAAATAAVLAGTAASVAVSPLVLPGAFGPRLAAAAVAASVAVLLIG